MPIEFVCKIKFAEEDEKQKAKQDGDTESLIEESCARPAKDLAGFANSCSLHGINHIFVSGRLGIRQTLWALAFVASLVLFLYQAAKCAISYLEHPHVTALNEEASPEMVFPAVTICNINRFRFSALTDADIYHLANLTGLPPKNRDGHKPTDLDVSCPWYAGHLQQDGTSARRDAHELQFQRTELLGRGLLCGECTPKFLQSSHLSV